MSRLAAACFAACVAHHAGAHDLWVERSGESYVLFQGHAFSTHAGEEKVPYDPSAVKRAFCAQADGPIGKLEPVRAYPVRVTGRCNAVLLEMISGYWAQTMTETHNRPKAQVSGALRGWRSEESVKRIDAWSPRLAQPLADGLELVPLENPLLLKPGDKLRVLASWRGQPLRGVAVAYGGDARGVTGRDGQANLRIRHGGMQILSASFEEPVQQDSNADRVVRGTLLQFALPQ